jgi:hypothetical protein
MVVLMTHSACSSCFKHTCCFLCRLHDALMVSSVSSLRVIIYTPRPSSSLYSSPVSRIKILSTLSQIRFIQSSEFPNICIPCGQPASRWGTSARHPSRPHVWCAFSRREETWKSLAGWVNTASCIVHALTLQSIQNNNQYR